jgi:glycerol-3-phosphate dehydrogenase (NAD(P)+)
MTAPTSESQTLADPNPADRNPADRPADRPLNVTLLGAGAWGNALATLARSNGHPVQQWTRRGELSLADAIANADVIINAISMIGVSPTAAAIAQLPLQPHSILTTATKGLDAQTLKTPSQIWQTACPSHPIVVLSGPNLSVEIEQGLPTATVVASHDPAAAAIVQSIFASDRFRVYTNNDPLGTELGGTLKNVIAIAVGVCDGLNLGANAKASLITRAMMEVIRIGTHLGGQSDTFFGLSGLGDMLATCNSPLSRNYRVGYGLAQGKTLNQIRLDLNSTAEGINTTNVLFDLARREGISTPIARLVYLLLNGQISPRQTIEALMERDLKAE